MARAELRPDEHVVRYVSHLGQIRDDNGNTIGLLWSAFDLREKIRETYLSINCLERANADLLAAMKAIRAYLATKKLRAPDAVLTIGNVKRIRDTFGHPQLKIASEPSKHDTSYGTIRNLPVQRRAALERLASSTWCAWFRVTDC